MALIVEDGTIVANADTFATLSELTDYANNYGVTIPDDDVTLEALLRRAFLQMIGMSWKGTTVNASQNGAFPRYNLYRNGFYISSSEVPQQIKMGQMALAAEIYADDLDPPEGRQGAVKSETVGPLTTSYATAPNYKARPAAARRSFSHFSGFLQPMNMGRIYRG